MEVKNTQKSTSVFEIPIKDYENDMEKDSSKEKKNEILDLFKNHNQIKSESEYDEIITNLHRACEEGDLDIIKILLCETAQNATNYLTFKIDKTNHTASLIKINPNLENPIIPRTVKHEMNDYLVTSICSLGCSFFIQSKIKNVKFEENSSVSTIYRYAFDDSNIEEIYFPKSLNELKEGWCYNTKNLKKNYNFTIKWSIYIQR